MILLLDLGGYHIRFGATTVSCVVLSKSSKVLLAKVPDRAARDRLIAERKPAVCGFRVMSFCLLSRTR